MLWGVRKGNCEKGERLGGGEGGEIGRGRRGRVRKSRVNGREGGESEEE